MKKFVLILLCTILLTAAISGEENRNVDPNLIYNDLDDEYKLASYFLNHQQKKYFKKLAEEDRWKYLQAFWKANDLDPITEVNEFLTQIKLRIDYANQHFTHFRPGWTTDRGRIYIRNGAPYEVISTTSGMNAKYSRKDLEIWKYRITSFQTYLFIDLQQHGDYRLIFSENDPAEGSWSDWDSYLGSDFDEGLLY